MIKLMQEWDVVSWEELEERDKVKRANCKWSYQLVKSLRIN